MRHPLACLVVAGTITLAGPAAPAFAAADYVVTLRPDMGVTCERSILDVIVEHGITADRVYTDSVCGFAARLSRSDVRRLSADVRVGAVVADVAFTGN